MTSPVRLRSLVAGLPHRLLAETRRGISGQPSFPGTAKRDRRFSTPNKSSASNHVRRIFAFLFPFLIPINQFITMAGVASYTIAGQKVGGHYVRTNPLENGSSILPHPATASSQSTIVRLLTGLIFCSSPWVSSARCSAAPTTLPRAPRSPLPPLLLPSTPAAPTRPTSSRAYNPQDEKASQLVVIGC